MLVTALAAAYVVSAVLTSAVVVVAWRRRREAPGFLATAWLAAAIVHWSVTDAALVLSRDPAVVYYLVVASFPGSCLLAASWWCLSYAFTDRTWLLSRRVAALLAVEPVICLVAAVTDPWHHQFIRHLRPTGVDDVLAPVFGPFFWLHSAYTFSLLSIALIRLVRGWASTSSRYQGHLFALAISLPTLACNVVGLASNGRLPDLTAIGFAVTAPLLYWMVSRLSLPAVAPVAHERVFEKISDAIMVIDLQNRILNLNPAAERILRLMVVDPPSHFVGVPLTTLLGMAKRPFPVHLDLSQVGADRQRTIEDAGGCGLDLNIRLGNVYDRRDRVIGRVMVARDVTAELAQQRALQDANQRLREQLHTIEALRAGLAEQAVRDHLTGLYNRRHLAAELDAAVLAAEPLAVVILDIDHFKQVNDRYGHAAGDAVLVHLAATLGTAVRPGDLLARHGGEEFVLVLRGLDAAGAVRRADDLRRLVRDRPAVSDGVRIAVTFSAGVAAFTGAESADDLLRLADEALYAAKRNGRDRVEPASELVDHPA